MGICQAQFTQREHPVSGPLPLQCLRGKTTMQGAIGACGTCKLDLQVPDDQSAPRWERSADSIPTMAACSCGSWSYKP